MEEIIRILTSNILKLINDEKFQYIKLKIKRLERNVGFQGYFINDIGERKSLNVWDFDFDTNIIHDLYRVTQEHQFQHANWNRAIFTLFPTNEFEIEYIWDQELQDEVDRINNNI